MAGLLIIESNMEIVRRIQKQFESINKNFSPKTTFCYTSPTESGELVLMSVGDVITSNVQAKTGFYGQLDAVLRLLDEFILNNLSQEIMIVINPILISSYDVMTLQNYEDSKEYTCLIYHHLIKLRNVYSPDIPSENIGFFLYSPSSYTVCTMSHLLTELYRDEEKEYFPKEACEPANISWCRSLRIKDNDTNSDILTLPLSYREFIRDFN